MFQPQCQKGKTLNRKLLPIANLITVVALALYIQTVSAHETVTVGDHDIDYGWVNEPVIVTQPNAIVINISRRMTMSGSVNVMGPADGAAVQGDQIEVSVRFDGLPANARDAGVHWHLFIDDQLLAMMPLVRAPRSAGSPTAPE
jgi:hypothetical protein